MTLAPGTRLGHYEILASLGGGGMGEVYRARDLNLDRIVAVKVLPEYTSEQADALLRFEREVQAIASLNDRRILAIHDYGDHEGRRYAVTELLEGETLAERIERGPIEWSEALEIALDIARGLGAAHEKGVIHRDLKPSNILIASSGDVKILDFGLASTVDPSMIENIVPGRTIPLQATPGAILGAVGYLSPEQARDEPVEPSTDIFSFGCVFFEMLTGHRPFQRQTAADTITAILNADPPELSRFVPDLPPGFQSVVARCLNKSVDQRFANGLNLLSALVKLRQDLTPSEIGPTEVRRNVNRPLIGIGVIAVLAIIALGLGTTAYHQFRAFRARERVLPEIERLSREGNYLAALRLAEKAMAVIPENPRLQELVAAARQTVVIETRPRGADVYYMGFDEPDAEWQALGKTPMQTASVPKGLLRWKLELEGYRTLVSGMPSVIPGASRSPLNFTLEPEEEAPEGMVYVPPGLSSIPFSGFDPLDSIPVPGYHIDQYEVTNAAYQEFVEQGGYRTPDYWQVEFLDENGVTLSFEDAMKRFVDRSGQPGPSTWELGRFAEGQEELPVAGISWYEAAAYANFRGKQLPTLHQWGRAALSPLESAAPVSPGLVPLSNFSGEGPRPGSDLLALSPSGAVNMAGNVREWCWTEADEGRRYILGGAWNDPASTLAFPTAVSPMDRSPGNGFRCVSYLGTLPPTLLAAIPGKIYAFDVRPPLSEDAFHTLGEKFEAPDLPLEARLETSDDAHEDWILETATLACSYDDQPLQVLLFLPRSAEPPYQTVVYYPGGDFILHGDHNSIENLPSFDPVNYLPASGRALVLPIYWGTFERARVRKITAPGHIDHGGEDLARTLQYLATREDIDSDRLAYLGFSIGSVYGTALLPYRPEFKAAVLISGGLAEFTDRSAFSFSGLLPYIKLPVLMLNGEFDYLFPVEASQNPYFERLGAPDEDKRHVVYPAGHYPLPRHELIRESLDWFDKYLGPVALIEPELADAQP